MCCCPTEARPDPAIACTPRAPRRPGWRAAWAAGAAACLALTGCGGGGAAADAEAASAYLVARYAGVDGLNGAPWAPARDKLVAAGVTLRSARCVHRLAQAGEVQGDAWAGDPPVWVVIEISSRQRDKARSADSAWADYDGSATTLWAPYQGNAASCPATAA